jgi:magnesium-transporting ATPase (P-type)
VDCGDAGLSSAEAAGRLNRHEFNRLTPPKPRSVLMRFLAQFNNALIYVLLVAAGISLALGEVVDATVMAGVAVIGIVQEGRAEQTLDAIRDMLSLNASVTRDGRRLGSGAASIPPQAGCPNSIFMRQSLRSLVAGVIL